MRRQYHIRPHRDGNLVWDVHQLIHQARKLPVKPVALNKIAELDETFWYDSTKDFPTVRSIADHMPLIDEADLSYPIILCPEGRVMDGMHRIAKAYLAKQSTIMAKQFEQMPTPNHVNVALDELDYSDKKLELT